MNSIIIYIFAMIFVVDYVSVMIKAQNCSDNEIQESCATPVSCQPSCLQPNGTICPRKRICIINGCVCKRDYVRNDLNENECIHPSECVIPSNESEECSSNEVYNSCPLLLSCQATCDQPDVRPCPAVCGHYPCQCKTGYVRTSQDDPTCIKQTECKTTNSSKCEENEEYNHLATQCQPSCEQPNRQPCPRFRYSKGCMCKEGFYRATNNVTSPCIQCPIILDSF